MLVFMLMIVLAPGILGRRGTAFYAREFDLAANTPGLLYFAACSFYCLVRHPPSLAFIALTRTRGRCMLTAW